MKKTIQTIGAFLFMLVACGLWFKDVIIHQDLIFLVLHFMVCGLCWLIVGGISLSFASSYLIRRERRFANKLLSTKVDLIMLILAFIFSALLIIVSPFLNECEGEWRRLLIYGAVYLLWSVSFAVFVNIHKD